MNAGEQSVPEFDVRSPDEFPVHRRGKTPDRTEYRHLIDAMGDGCVRFPVADQGDRKRLAGRLRNAMNKLDVPVTISASGDRVWMKRRAASKKPRKGKSRRSPFGDGKPKLTDDEVRDVRCRGANRESLASIARDKGVSTRTVRRVLERKAYRDLPDSREDILVRDRSDNVDAFHI